MSHTCPKCGNPQVQWSTHSTHVPVDLLRCTNCGHVLAQEDWTAPTLPYAAGRCMNCCGFLENEYCTTCGLHISEDFQVHDELRQMIAPQLGLMDAGLEANRQGRRVLALKLATAASASNEHGRGEEARAFRIWLLQSIGEATAALNDAKSWVESNPDASAEAWAVYGKQLQASAFTGAAADAYQKALKLDPYQHSLRARRADLLFKLRRNGQGQEELGRLFLMKLDDKTAQLAVTLAENLANQFEEQLRDHDIQHLLEQAGAYVDLSPTLLAHRAMLQAKSDKPKAARKDLKAARRLNPELPIYERVEKLLKPSGGSWWRW